MDPQEAKPEKPTAFPVLRTCTAPSGRIDQRPQEQTRLRVVSFQRIPRISQRSRRKSGVLSKSWRRLFAVLSRESAKALSFALDFTNFAPVGRGEVGAILHIASRVPRAVGAT